MSKKFQYFETEVTFNDGTVYTRVIDYHRAISGSSPEYEAVVNILTDVAFERFDGWFTIRVHGMLSGSPHDWHLEQVPEEIMDMYPHDMEDILPF